MAGDGERRRLVFTNLANGHTVPAVMETLHLSEKEVMADFKFTSDKLRSYRFSRSLTPFACSTIEEVRRNRVEALFWLSRLNLENPAIYKVQDLSFTIDEGGTMSEAERVMAEMRMRAGGAR